MALGVIATNWLVCFGPVPDRRVDVEIQVESWGDGPRVVLVHGVMSDGPSTWLPQRELAGDWTLIVPTRRGYVPNPPILREDYDADADDVVALLGDGAHLVGHSIGGLVALLAAARSPETVKSLCLVEPATFALARHDPGVATDISTIEELSARAPDLSPREFLAETFAAVGWDASVLPNPLPAEMEQHVRLMMNYPRYWEMDLPVAEVADAPWGKVVVSGGHRPVQEAICDATAKAIRGERLTLTGAGHLIQRAPGFNDLLRRIWIN
jgi:pimeloyl-ACP methyl ester carboxylesterase